MISETFCALPWVHIATSTRGFYRFCCNQSYIEEDFKKGGYLNTHYIYERSIEDMWNSSSYRSARVKMLTGQKVGSCHRCYREEEAGIRSARMTQNEVYSYLANIELDPDGFCPTNFIRYFDIRLGNLCNLKCRMCNPHSSSAWISDEKLAKVRDTPEKELIQLSNMDWFNSDFFWENLFSAMENCEVIYVSGGEPTILAGQQFKLFDKVIENGSAKNIRLRYNTNLTIHGSEFEKYWKQFKEVTLNCSIDGFGKVNDYIRYPSKWKNIEKNLLRMCAIKKEMPLNFKMKAMTTPQMYNIFDLVNLFEYLKQLKMFPLLNILNQPQYHNIRVLHKDQKDKAANILTNWYEKNKEWLFEHDAQEKNYIKLPQMIEYMLEEDWSHLYPNFLRETYILDGIRDQRLKDFIPELA